ncbi:MAG: hypothetical protein KAT43_05840 [Nanoarchaeota archaeon]|nr:hypothetical protein [Nanoarchaeota archaeon]
MVEEEPRGRRLEERAIVPDGVGDEYKVSAVKGLGFLGYIGRYRETQEKINTTSDSDRSLPTLHDDYKASLWRFARKVYEEMRYRTTPVEESELDRLTDPKEDAWMERWFGKIGVEDREVQDRFYRELFKDQILAAKYILAERGYKLISRAEQQETVQIEQRNLRWWVVGAAAAILLIATTALVGTGWYVYHNYVKPFNKLRQDVESGEIVNRFPRYGITDGDIDKIKEGFRKMTPEERRELLFGIPPSKKEEQKEDKKEEEKQKEELEETTKEKPREKPNNQSQPEESEF